MMLLTKEIEHRLRMNGEFIAEKIPHGSIPRTWTPSMVLSYGKKSQWKILIFFVTIFGSSELD